MNMRAKKLFVLPIALCALAAVLFASAFTPTVALAETTFNLTDWYSETDAENNAVLLYKYIGKETKDYTIPATVELNGVEYKVGLLRNADMYESMGQYFDSGEIENLSFENGVFVDDYEGLFVNNENLVSVDLNGLEAINPTSTKQMFDFCTSLKKVDIASILTSSIKDMSGMFNTCKALQVISYSDVDTSSVTDMGKMFLQCESIAHLSLVEEFDTSNVTEMRSMFQQCSSLCALYLNSFDTSSVEKMDDIFAGCTSLLGIIFTGSGPVPQALDATPQSTDMFTVPAGAKLGFTSESKRIDNRLYSGLWAQDSDKETDSITAAELEAKAQADGGLSGIWYRQDAITDWEYSIKDDGAGTSWVVLRKYIGEETTYTIPASYSCDDKTYPVLLPSSSTLDLGGIENLSFDNEGVYAEDGYELFNEAVNLKTIKLAGLKFVNSNVSLVDMLHLCSALTSVDFTGFDTSKVTSMMGLFRECSSLESIDLSGLDTSSVISTDAMFAHCYSLKNINFGSIDTSQVTDMAGMFGACESLESIDLSQFDTSSVTDMQAMFMYCSSLKSLDLSSFDTSKVEDMRYMFNNCENLTSVVLSENFVIGENTKTDEMLPAPTKTASGAESSGKWGLASEKASVSYSPAEFIQNAQGGASLKGTWYAQAVATDSGDTDDGDNSGKDKGSDKDNSSDKKSDDKNSGSLSKKKSEVPQTGDPTNLAAIATMSAAGLVCAGAALALKKR